MSSNVNGVVWAILNLRIIIIFLRKDFVRTKSTKTQPSKSAKMQISKQK